LTSWFGNQAEEKWHDTFSHILAITVLLTLGGAAANTAA
jgi:hypothetical protein